MQDFASGWCTSHPLRLLPNRHCPVCLNCMQEKPIPALSTSESLFRRNRWESKGYFNFNSLSKQKKRHLTSRLFQLVFGSHSPPVRTAASWRRLPAWHQGAQHPLCWRRLWRQAQKPGWASKASLLVKVSLWNQPPLQPSSFIFFLTDAQILSPYYCRFVHFTVFCKFLEGHSDTPALPSGSSSAKPRRPWPQPNICSHLAPPPFRMFLKILAEWRSLEDRTSFLEEWSHPSS